MPIRLPRLIWFLAFALPQGAALAAVGTPQSTLDAVMGEVMLRVRQEAGAADGPAVLPQEVEARVLELFDFPRMAQTVLARHWRQATPAQHELLTVEFKGLLVRTLCIMLAEYGDELGEFRPLRPAPGGGEIRMRSELRQDGRQRMSVDYDMERTADGWKAYDVKFGGVSLIAMLRDAFTAARDADVEELIRSLAKANSEMSSAVPSSSAALAERNRIVFAILRSALQGRR